MSARDFYHNTVKVALQKDGWTITHDPLTLEFALGRQLKIDLGAEQILAARKENQLIAVEIKSFLGSSAISEFHTALGQFLNYRVALKYKEPERQIFLAVALEIYKDFFSEEISKLSVKEYQVSLLVFDPKKEEIVQWMP